MESTRLSLKGLAPPPKLEPPEVEYVSPRAIELCWHYPLSDRHQKDEKKPLTYCIQQREENKNFQTIYEGYSLCNVFTGLKPFTQYSYRVRCVNIAGPSRWSDAVTVTTKHTSAQLHCAIQGNDLQAVKYIIKENFIYLEMPDAYGSSPLMTASRMGLTEMVRLLLELGASPNYVNPTKKTSLMEACYHGHIEVIKLLRAATASWFAEDKKGMTSLNWAVTGCKCDVVEFILAQGVPVDYIGKGNTCGWTPLQALASKGNGSPAVAEVLIRHNANVNAKSTDVGNSILASAFLSHNIEVIKLLLRNGACPTIKNDKGYSALDMALDAENPVHKNVAFGKTVSAMFRKGLNVTGRIQTKMEISIVVEKIVQEEKEKN